MALPTAEGDTFEVVEAAEPERQDQTDTPPLITDVDEEQREEIITEDVATPPLTTMAPCCAAEQEETILPEHAVTPSEASGDQEPAVPEDAADAPATNTATPEQASVPNAIPSNGETGEIQPSQEASERDPEVCFSTFSSCMIEAQKHDIWSTEYQEMESAESTSRPDKSKQKPIRANEHVEKRDGVASEVVSGLQCAINFLWCISEAHQETTTPKKPSTTSAPKPQEPAIEGGLHETVVEYKTETPNWMTSPSPKMSTSRPPKASTPVTPTKGHHHPHGSD